MKFITPFLHHLLLPIAAFALPAPLPISFSTCTFECFFFFLLKLNPQLRSNSNDWILYVTSFDKVNKEHKMKQTDDSIGCLFSLSISFCVHKKRSNWSVRTCKYIFIDTKKKRKKNHEPFRKKGTAPKFSSFY